jgi:hypothetical protein
VDSSRTRNGIDPLNITGLFIDNGHSHTTKTAYPDEGGNDQSWRGSEGTSGTHTAKADGAYDYNPDQSRLRYTQELLSLGARLPCVK